MAATRPARPFFVSAIDSADLKGFEPQRIGAMHKQQK